LSFEREKDADGRRKSGQSVEARAKPQSKKKGPGSGDVGNALRSVYQHTVDERIPPDLLDLLGKLG
jgi:hypothetical protein